MIELTRLVARLQAELAEPAALYLPLAVAGSIVGHVREDHADALRAWPRLFRITAERIAVDPRFTDPASLTSAFDEVCRELCARGLLSRWRDERYRVATSFATPPLFAIERAAARFFGIRTWAAHVNGLVGARASDAADVGTSGAGTASNSAASTAGHPVGTDSPDTRMWIARRSPEKPIDPGMLDNLVGGGVREGASVRETVVREAWEEAGIDAAYAARCVPAGLVHILRAQPDGLQRESLFVHDLVLPPAFHPVSQDGESVEHRLCTFEEVLTLAAEPDAMTLDATLVAVDHLVRRGWLVPDQPGYLEVAGARCEASWPVALRRSR